MAGGQSAADVCQSRSAGAGVAVLHWRLLLIDLTWHCRSPMRAVAEHCFAIRFDVVVVVVVCLAGHGDGGAVEGSKAHGFRRVQV